MLPKPYFERDGITLYHGHCREILPGLGKVDCTVTSPPYNQIGNLPENGSGLWGKTDGGAGFLRAWKESGGYADDMDEEEYQRWQNEVFSVIHSKTSPTGSLFYNHQIRWRDGNCIHPVDWFKPSGWNLRSDIVWDRGGGMMLNARMFVRFDERILWFVAGDSWNWNQESVGHGTIWRIAREQQRQGKLHPVAYPIDIPIRCIEAVTEPSETILDPFAGSATTLLAAWRLGRKAIGIELSEAYCEISANRLNREMDQGRLFKPEPVAFTQPSLLE